MLTKGRFHQLASSRSLISPTRPSAKPCTVRVQNGVADPTTRTTHFAVIWKTYDRLSRAFYSQHRRFPTTDEALLWLQENRRYSGEWEGNLSRPKRVQQILDFTRTNI